MSGLDPNPYRSLHSANPHIKESRPLPLPESPSNYIQPHIWGGDGTPIQLPATHHTTQFCLKVPQFIMALDEKYAPFAHQNVTGDPHWKCSRKHKQRVYQELPSHSCISQQLETHSCLNQSPSLIGKTVSQLHAPFWMARSTALNVFPEIELFTSLNVSFRYWLFT